MRNKPDRPVWRSHGMFLGKGSLDALLSLGNSPVVDAKIVRGNLTLFFEDGRVLKFRRTDGIVFSEFNRSLLGTRLRQFNVGRDGVAVFYDHKNNEWVQVFALLGWSLRMRDHSKADIDIFWTK